MVSGRFTPEMEDNNMLGRNKEKVDELLSRDAYREKVNRHLTEMIEERCEMEEDMLQKTQKISDLQKALVDMQLSCFQERERFLTVSAENERLKKNEGRLHEDIRQLLDITKDKPLRDRIVYILNNPNVDIAFKYNNDKKTELTAPTMYRRSSADLLKDQIKSLHSQLEEYTRVSKDQSDILLQDCKLVLENSKTRIQKDGEVIVQLKKKLQVTAAELEEIKKSFNLPPTSSSQSVPDLHKRISSASSENISHRRKESSRKMLSSKENVSTFHGKKKEHLNDLESFNMIRTCKDIELTLLLLSKILKDVVALIKEIRSTNIFKQTAKIPMARPGKQVYVPETDIIRLQDHSRQCSVLCYDAKNMLNSLQNYETNYMKKEMEQLDIVLQEVSVATSNADLYCISLDRSSFFDFLSRPVLPFQKFGVKETSNHAKYISEFKEMENHIKTATDLSAKASNIMQGITMNIEHYLLKNSDLTKTLYVSGNRGNSHSHDSNRPASAPEGLVHHNSSDKENSIKSSKYVADTFTRKIDKTLAKIGQLKKGDYLKDAEFCKHLSEEVNSLAEKLKELYDEFNISKAHEQFAEYTSVVLSKLKLLEKRNSDAVTTAEAQICAQRSSTKLLSVKLKKTEELLRESINECLRLKHKVCQMEDQNTVEKSQWKKMSSTRLHKNAEDDDDDESSEQIKNLKTQLRKLKSRLETIANSDEDSVSKVVPSVRDVGVQNSRPLSGFNKDTDGKYESIHKSCNEKISKLDAQLKNMKIRLQRVADFNEVEAAVNELVACVEDESLSSSSNSLKNSKTRLQRDTQYDAGNSEQIRNLKAQVRKLKARLETVVDFDDELSIRKVVPLVKDVGMQSSRQFTEVDEGRYAPTHKSCNEKIRKLELQLENTKLRLRRVADFSEVDLAVSELAATIRYTSTQEFHSFSSPYECFYCKQGSTHKLCDEKIKELKATVRQLTTELKLVKEKLKEEQKVSKISQEQAEATIFDSVTQSQHLKANVESLEAKTKSLLEQLKLAKGRLEKMEQFHRLQTAGFQTDIKNLKGKFSDMQKQLIKAVVIFENDKKDLELLQTIHATTQHSTQAVTAIKRLKAKLYQLESDIKYL